MTFHTTKVTPEDIFQNGNLVGSFEGTPSEVWVIMTDPRDGIRKAVARFKYMKPKMKAKKMFRNVLKRFTVAEVIDGMKDTSPVEFCRDNNVDYTVN